MNTYYVYILVSLHNNVLYIWVTNNLKRRVFEHKEKLVAWFSATYNCTKLVYYEECHSIEDAIGRDEIVSSNEHI
jgi:putative endonuclease